MTVPDRAHWKLDDHVQWEPSDDDGRLGFWIPQATEGGYRDWERISNVARADVVVEQGICGTAAASIRARERIGGMFGKLLAGLRKPKGDRNWTLPDGGVAEQYGPRRTDLVLAWPETDTDLLDEARISARWPESTGCRRLGQNLFLVSGVENNRFRGAAAPPEPQPPDVRGATERALTHARAIGDRRLEASTLVDLGAACELERDFPRAIGALQDALAIARQLGDSSLTIDALNNLGSATEAAGQVLPARALFHEAQALAQSTGASIPQKVALERLASSFTRTGDLPLAANLYEQAIAVARQVSDKSHEAKLLWFLAIHYAELGHRDLALDRAQRSVSLLQELGKPEAACYADHLRDYASGDPNLRPLAAAPAPSFGGSMTASAATAPPPRSPAADPSVQVSRPLQMAISAAKALGKFVGSGLKTVDSATVQSRLQICSTCEHHTGLRCRVCGCFTTAKAHLPHESCPLAKWPRL